MMFGDFGDSAKQRDKMKEEIDELLENENTTLADIFSLKSQEKQDEIMNQLRWGNKKVVAL
jgi:predicted Zn-ribbon and HTH transcriptional regulator